MDLSRLHIIDGVVKGHGKLIIHDGCIYSKKRNKWIDFSLNTHLKSLGYQWASFELYDGILKLPDREIKLEDVSIYAKTASLDGKPILIGANMIVRPALTMDNILEKISRDPQNSHSSDIMEECFATWLQLRPLKSVKCTSTSISCRMRHIVSTHHITPMQDIVNFFRKRRPSCRSIYKSRSFQFARRVFSMMRSANEYHIKFQTRELTILQTVWCHVVNIPHGVENLVLSMSDCYDGSNVVCLTGRITRILTCVPDIRPKKSDLRQLMLSKASVLRSGNLPIWEGLVHTFVDSGAFSMTMVKEEFESWGDL